MLVSITYFFERIHQIEPNIDAGSVEWKTNQMDLNVTDSSANIQNIPVEKIVQVGDIEIAYKMSGKGDPILFVSGDSADKNA